MSKEITQFKYEQLDDSTADFLRKKERSIKTKEDRIVGDLIEIGRDLYESQQELANNYRGVFEKWYTAIGYERQNVYNLINRYKLVLAECENIGDIDVVEKMPVTVLREITRKDSESTPEKAQAKSEVLAGGIATLKEYRERIKELEKKAEQAEQQAEAERMERERLEVENEKLSNREPEVITEYIEKETSEPYDRRLDEPYSVERGRSFYEMMNEVDALYKKYAHLKDGIEELSRLAYYDDDMKLKYRKADEFWRMLSGIFNENNDNIIDVEII